MAGINNIFGDARGAMGSVVFYTMNGKSYVRSKPSRFTDKKSPGQLAQRQRLQVMNEFLAFFRPLIRITFASEATGRTALQAAQSYNMKNALEGSYPEIGINKSKALLSKGPLPLPQHAYLTPNEQGLLIEWNNGEESTGSRATDTLVVIMFDPATKTSEYRFTNTTRSEGQYLYPLTNPDSQTPDIWIAFRNEQQTLMSDSLWVEK